MPAISSFDPYHAWLGIEPHEQPADYYRLLGLPRFEPDAGRIARAADERMALVRSYQVGPRGKYTQKLLNELSAARVCLLTPGSRQQYDAALARHLQLPPSPYMSQAAVPPAGVLSLGVQFPQPQTLAPPLATAPAPPPRLAPRFALDELAEDRGPIEIAAPQPWWRPIAAALAAAMLLLVAVGGYGFVRSRWPAPAQSSVPLPPPPPPVPEPPPPAPIVVMQEGSGELTLSPSTAVLAGQVQLQTSGAEEVLSGWTTADDSATWQFRLVKPGFFQAELTYATSETADEAELELAIGQRVTACRLRNSGSLDQFHRDVFTLVVDRSGEHTLRLRPRRLPAGAWLALKTVRLIPVGGDLQADPAGEPEANPPVKYPSCP